MSEQVATQTTHTNVPDRQTWLLETICDQQKAMIAEQRKTNYQLNELVNKQFDHSKHLDRIAKAATLYFVLTMMGIALVVGYLILILLGFPSFLRF